MNYRHIFHAGNFADVVKHAALARILVHLKTKPQAFRVVDIHAGAGRYDLSGEQASRTGEWRHGIGRVAKATLAPEAAELLAPYLEAVAAINVAGSLKRYPGSPLIALHLMRPQDRLIASELEPRAASFLMRNLQADRRAKALAVDGWVALNANIPPAERRGVVVIDPPFEAKDEFTRLGQGLLDAYRKWPTGIYLAWYPVKDMAPAPMFRRLIGGGIAKMLRVELHLGDPDPDRLNASGLVIVNPPWRLDAELKILMPALASALAAGASTRVLVEPIRA